MSSAARLAANAANAQQSTGPRTEEGKQRSSRNATRHGLTAVRLIVRDDEREEFEDLRRSLLREIRPQGALESDVFTHLLHASWNLRRLRRLEAELFSNGLDPLNDPAKEAELDRLSLYQARIERSYYRALKELRALQTNRVIGEECGRQDRPREETPGLAAWADVTKRTQHDCAPMPPRGSSRSTGADSLPPPAEKLAEFPAISRPAGLPPAA